MTGVQGWVEPGYGDILGSYIAITAPQAGTNVTVHLSPTGQVIAGGMVPGGGPGGSISFSRTADNHTRFELTLPVEPQP